MANKRYVVELTGEEREQLQALLKRKRLATKKRMPIQVLLEIDESEGGPGWSHARAAEAFDVHVNTVSSVAKKLVVEGLEAAITRKKHSRPGREAVIAGKIAVHTVERWVIPPDADGEFVARMEDLLALYAEPFSPAQPLPAVRGHPKRVDYEYRRSG